MMTLATLLARDRELRHLVENTNDDIVDLNAFASLREISEDLQARQPNQHRANLALRRVPVRNCGVERVQPGGSVRGERANLTRLVLLCIEAKFCNKICVGKLSPRSTQCT